MAKYWVTITDTASYPIEADSVEEAERIAHEWFIQREPDFNTEEVENFDD